MYIFVIRLKLNQNQELKWTLAEENRLVTGAVRGADQAVHSGAVTSTKEPAGLLFGISADHYNQHLSYEYYLM